MSDTGIATKPPTPAMRQFHHFKEQFPQCVLFFRMGDFYEMFHEDAELAHKVLGVTLTQRSAGVPMAGVPYHAVDGYLRRMIQAGYRVAICDQVEDPKLSKGVVKRDVTRIITPGTLTDDFLLEEGDDYPLAAVVFHSDVKASLAWAQLSTGSFRLGTFEIDQLADELARIQPTELLYVQTGTGQMPDRVKPLVDLLNCPAVGRPSWQFGLTQAVETLHQQYGVQTLQGFGLAQDDPALTAGAGIIHYLKETQQTNKSASSDDPDAAQAGLLPDREPGKPVGTVGETGSPGSPGAGGVGGRLSHLQPPRMFHRDQHMVIDHVSLHSLEVMRTLRSGQAQGSLLHVLAHCQSPMGKRLLRQWLCYPLGSKSAIEQRQNAVSALLADRDLLDKLRSCLGQVQDIQRMMGRIALGRALPRDLVGLGTSAGQGQLIAGLIDHHPALKAYHQPLAKIVAQLDQLAQAVAQTCVDCPPGHLRQGGLIRDGADQELDEVRALKQNNSSWLASYQKELASQTGISNIKVGFNKVFGFYIELTARQMGKAPPQWTRKQTLKNAERYITPELKAYEEKALHAQELAIGLEQAIFAKLCDLAQTHMPQLADFSQWVAALDVLANFAHVAMTQRYVRPTLVDEPVLDIVAGRHPVLDPLLGDQFVANDIQLATDHLSSEPTLSQQDSAHGLASGLPSSDAQISDDAPAPLAATESTGATALAHTLALITGPNMAGKSTYIRQAALITLLAHTGCFVPADRATIGLCDRIFTRVGASDELHAGHSTFMVEMTETANICHHATRQSLVILDEIGRGTSTLDGLALAWAIAEFLAARGCRTLFATHYHELTQLSEQHQQITNLNVSVREWQEQIVFLHRIVPGATDKSYGIHVAQIAGLPTQVVKRANELLDQLQVSHQAGPIAPTDLPTVAPDEQLSLFTQYLEHPIADQLRQIDLDALSPIQAFDQLRQLKASLDAEMP